MTQNRKPHFRNQLTTIQIAFCPGCKIDLPVVDEILSGEYIKMYKCKTPECNYFYPVEKE